MEQSLQLINEFLDRLFIYGPWLIYLTLFAASFVENIFPPFPGDFFTLTGGALAASGRLEIAGVFAAVYVGGICSLMLVYYLGRRFGRDYFIAKNFRYFSADDIRRLEDWFARKGLLLILFNRFIVGARAVITLVAGMSNYRAGPMFLFASISFWIFNSLLLFGTYIFVVNFETIAYYFHLYERIVWPIIIIIAIILIVLKIRKTKKSAA